MKKQVAAMALAAMCLAVPAQAAEVADCKLLSGCAYTLRPDEIDEALELLRGIEWAGEQRGASLDEFGYEWDPEAGMTLRTPAGEAIYVGLENDGVMSVQTPQWGSYFFTTVPLDPIIERIRAWTAQRVPDTFAYGGGETRLLDSTSKEYVLCAPEDAARLASLAGGLVPAEDGAELGARLPGVDSVKLLHRTYLEDVELYERGVRWKWSGIADPGRGPDGWRTFTYADGALPAAVQPLFERGRRGPSWLGMINPGKLSCAWVDGEQVFDRAAIRSMLDAVAIVPGSGGVSDVRSAALPGGRTLLVEFAGGNQYRIQYNADTLRVYSADVDYELQYRLDAKNPSDGGKAPVRRVPVWEVV